MPADETEKQNTEINIKYLHQKVMVLKKSLRGTQQVVPDKMEITFSERQGIIQ